MANEAPDAIIRKIQKLLEMAGRAKGNEQEAAVAMAKAQEMMAQYNLDMAIVKDTFVEGGTTQQEVKRESKKINRSAQYDWQKELWGTLAMCNFCFHSVVVMDEKLVSGRDPSSYKYRRVKRHVVLGRVDNVTMVEMMGEYLCDTIERLLPEKDNARRLSRESISWRAGCGQRLRERLYQQFHDREKTMRSQQRGDGLPGLVLRDLVTKEYIANYDHMYGQGAHDQAVARQAKWELEQKQKTPEQVAAEEAANLADLKKNQAKYDRQDAARQRQRARKYDHGAFSQGYVKGNDVGLDTQVSSGTPNSTKVLD